MNSRPPEELIEAIHTFPGVYRIKAIGEAQNDFAGRVVAAVMTENVGASDVEYSIRSTKGGRHDSVTLDIAVQTAEQVRAIYAKGARRRRPGDDALRGGRFGRTRNE